MPFEKKIYEQAKVPVSFVGHPLLDKIADISSDPHVHRNALGLPLSARLFALLPGSRKHEVSHHMPVLLEAIQTIHQQFPNSHFVLPIAGTLDPQSISTYCSQSNIPITLVQGNALQCMAAADFVIVASGTASLECTLLEKPMCIIYKSTWINAYLAMKWIRVRFFGLCNLLADKMIVPEFLQHDCNAHELSLYISQFYNNVEQPKNMISQLAGIKDSLSMNRSDCSLVDVVLRELQLTQASVLEV